MPRKNKRKFFGGKSNKSKTVKLSEEQDDQNAQVDINKQQSNESDTEENNAEGEFQLRKSAVHSSISSVSNDSTVSTPETNATKMGAKFSSSPRWCSEPNLTANNNSLRQQRATIQLKIIQFIGNTSATEISEAVKEEENLHEDENVFHAAGAVPKLDHYKEDEANEPQQQKQQRFDDNYRVESPKQISSLSHDLIGIDDENNDKEDECRNKRHAMLIQEISESSSSEEVKKYLDNEASAIEMKMIEKIDSIKPYRVESPASSDENSNKLSSQTDDNNLAQTVHEICESSSSESVKNDEKTKIATLNLKIINIQELPTENNNKTSTLSSSSPSPKAKIKLFECKSEKKLNKAEEAIIEALYGNSNLLQIPNTPLDVISEEGSDCCSDIDATTTKLQHHKTTTYENDIEDDDDVFLKSSTTTIAQRYRRNKKIAAIEEQPLLINTKLIETEINVPESCKKWETRQSDSELQAELVYLPSTSSSATDLSERSTDTEEVEEETSEDTETNSLLENITVPPLTLDITTIPTSAEQEHEHIYINDQLPDILEEDEDPKSITESQQLIEDVNKELHHLENFTVENKNKNLGDEKQEPKIALETNLFVRDDDDKKLINEQRQENSKSGTPTPTQPRRKYSSDSSTSSSNSQCTIIRQVMPIESIHPLKDLCIRSLDNYNNISTEGKVTVQKRCNSISRNAPNIPIINELELHYECDSDDLQSHEKKDKVITILQVPPEINNNNQSNSRSSSEEKKRWFGMQSSQMPNVMVALSPSQKDYMMTSSDSNATTTSADVLLDMHKKFVERRAYHEVSDDDDDDNGNNKNILRCENAKSEEIQLEDSNRSSNNGCSKSSSDESAIKLKIVESDIDNESSNSCRSSLVINDNRESAENKQQELNNEEENMNTIRSLILREKFFNDNKNEPSTAPIVTSDEFKVKKCELEDELIRLDYERKELEEELRNIQSLQHFKREEFLYNQRKLQKQQEENKNVEHEIVVETNHNRHSMNNGKYVNDDFSNFINSNEKLHKEIYNEWQDKVLERNERKLQKTLKITSINEITRDELQPLFRERAASERIIKLNDEFLERVKERQKRLSLPLDDNLDASTESLLNDDDDHNVGGARKKKKKFFHFDNKENFPAHFREFIEYCEQEIEISKNSVESGIWSEQNRSEDSLEKKLDSPPPPPVWSPKSAPASPTVERKFRPVPFESPTLQRKKHPSIESPSPPPWNQPDYQDKPYQPSIIKSSSLSTISAPRIKQPNHIVFKKARADQFNEKFDKGITLSPKDKSVTFKTASLKPSKSNELVYSIKQNSETKDSNNNNNNNFIKTQEITTTRKMTTQQQQSPKKVDGVGPISKEGIPLSLRSEVTDESREQWYKKMYNTIHKAKDDENYVTVKYKTRRGIPYKSNGYASEPDANYDSDYVIKYSSGSNNLDRQRTLSASNQSEERYGSIEQPVKPNACQYKNQPGRIENYTPGKSSVSDKEAKQWWDDIMEIFDGHLEQQKLASNYTQGNLSRALKDQGYQSDSTLVFKKKSDVEQLSPVQQKIAYKSFQHGGEVPLHGFRKQAPEKPKDIDTFTHSPTTPPLVPIKHNYNLSGYFSDSQKKYVENDVNIHYKVPVRYEFKHAIPDDELARQQAEHMKKVYQEERRRKYLQELQDMSNRRHTDNFTPSQKSPIALNRYDDFACEPPSKSPVNLPGTVARALYSFQGQSNRELSFKKGDIIYIRRQIDKNWYEGEHNAMIGLLPVQYVDIISNDGIRPPIRKPTEGQARAKYNFVAQSDIELSLNKGELVSLTRRVDANWFEGRIGARKGIFPVSYVDVLTDIGSEDLENNLVTTTTTTVTKSFIPSTPSPISFSPNSDIVRETKTIRKTEVLHVDTANEPITYRAMYNYRPVNSDELELREGDLIYVLEQCDDGWFVGTNSRNGFFGTFPGNYVKRVY